MENNDVSGFLPIWHNLMTIGFFVFLGIAILMYVIHKIRINSISDPKEKYDYIRNNEIKYYRNAFYSVGISIFMLVNTYGKGDLEFDYVWFFVRFFIAVAAGTLVGYIAQLILQYYHPTQLSKKLKKYRYMPRINPKTGNKMRLLSEEEEDVHLEEGMMAEENVFSIDYDVWIDDSTEEIKIEKYEGHLEALQCNNCGFYTMRVKREEILNKPTKTEPGELIKHYECSYCGSVRATKFRIAPNNDELIGKQPETAMKKTNWSVIRIEMMNDSGARTNYEFQSADQAIQFLKEAEAESRKTSV